jgi:membrane-bound metal-dependent hydrolase YbcI (DUF457 family)
MLAFKGGQTTSFAVGHMGIGYLIGKASGKSLKVNPNIPALLVLSIIPDIDIPFGDEFHRGPTHSAIAALLVFIPFFIVYRKKAVPYFLALLSHALVGDLIGGGIQLLWPITSNKVFLTPWIPKIEINSPVNVALELIFFTVATIVMLKAKDWQLFFQNRKTNLLLAIPIATVLLPTFVAYPLTVPFLLVAPHLFYLVLFTIAVFAVLTGFSGRRNGKST